MQAEARGSLPWIEHGLDQYRSSDLDVRTPGKQKQHQICDVLGVQALAVVKPGAIIRHLCNDHPRTDSIDPDVEVLILALNVLRKRIQRVFGDPVRAAPRVVLQPTL